MATEFGRSLEALSQWIAFVTLSSSGNKEKGVTLTIKCLLCFIASFFDALILLFRFWTLALLLRIPSFVQMSCFSKFLSLQSHEAYIYICSFLNTFMRCLIQPWCKWYMLHTALKLSRCWCKKENSIDPDLEDWYSEKTSWPQALNI